MRAPMLAGLALLWAANADAALNISTGPTKHVSCTAGVCTATAKTAVLNVGDLQAMLAASDVTVKTGGGAVTIGVLAPLTWASSHGLTLDAALSIHFNAPTVVEGNGGVTLITNDGESRGTLSFVAPGSLAFWDLSSSLTIDGTAYTLVGDIASLDQDIAADPQGHYALANDYDAAADGAYVSAPVKTALTGTFEGLGHAIRNLTINVGGAAKNYVGFFKQIGGRAFVRDFGLENFAITAPAGTKQHFIGALAGKLGGTKSQSGCICNAYASGSLTIGRIDQVFVGGLVGFNSGRISNSHCDCTVTVDPFSFSPYSGGLVGYNTGRIETSYATGTVSGSNSGGLVGQNFAVGGEDWTGQIVDSYATATVYAGGNNGNGGGLVAVNQGPITNSHASGDIHVTSAAEAPVGGLVGRNTQSLAVISNSYATGNVATDGFGSSTGGLVGANDGGRITHSFATGAAKGDSAVGGLIGENNGPVDNSYALGAVEAGSDGSVGGLIGSQEFGDIDFSYSAGAVSGGHRDEKGGLIGRNAWNHETDAYWDTTTSGTHRSAGGTGLSDGQLKSALPDGFDPSVWGQNAAINGGLPYLIVVPPN